MSENIHKINLDGQEFLLEDSYARDKIETLVQVVSTTEECKDNDVLYTLPQMHSLSYRGTIYRTASFKHFDDDIEQGGEFVQVCFYSKSKGGFVVTYDDAYWNPSDMTPIGIVVVPLSHNVYGDGSVGVMSLVNMSWKTPDIGDINRSQDSEALIVWGGNSSGLPHSNSIPILGNCSASPKNNVTGALNGNVFMPTDASWATGPMCDTDITTKYYASTDGSRGWGPSPFTGSARNSLYYSTYTTNPLAKYNGDEFTDLLCEKSTYQLNWQTDSEIENKFISNHYPAALCCRRYYTDHTKQGDWYLPAEGELGYVIARYGKITKTVNRLNSIFGKVAKDIEYEITQNYWSSCVGNDTQTYRISTYNGTLGASNNSNTYCCRAFTKIIPLEVF